MVQSLLRSLDALASLATFLIEAGVNYVQTPEGREKFDAVVRDFYDDDQTPDAFEQAAPPPPPRPEASVMDDDETFDEMIERTFGPQDSPQKRAAAKYAAHVALGNLPISVAVQMAQAEAGKAASSEEVRDDIAAMAATQKKPYGEA